MTKAQKNWLALLAVTLFLVFNATGLHIDRVLSLPLWSLVVIVLLVSATYISSLWLQPGKWHTTKLRYGLAYAIYFGMFMFLLRLSQDATQPGLAWGSAGAFGLFCGGFMGIMMGVRYTPQLLKKTQYSS